MRETVGGASVTSEVVVVDGATEVVVGATVVVVGATVVVGFTVEAGAVDAGMPATMFDALDSPIALTALMVTEYVVPFVSPEMVNGLVVVAGFSAM